MTQSGGFPSRLPGPLLKTGLPLIQNVIKQLAKSVSIPLGLTAATLTTDAGIHKKILGSGNPSYSHNNNNNNNNSNNTVLIIPNDEIEDIIKILKSLEDSGLLLEGITETVQSEVKKEKGGFLSTLLGTLGASLLGNLLTGKGIYRARKGQGINRAGEGIVRAGGGRPLLNNKMDF